MSGNTLKLEVGKQYKTCGGWRCVVVDNSGGYFAVWHLKSREVEAHRETGHHYMMNSELNDYDIISEWAEPKTHTVWIGLYDFSGKIRPCLHLDKPRKENAVSIKKITITEGEFDDEHLHPRRATYHGQRAERHCDAYQGAVLE